MIKIWQFCIPCSQSVKHRYVCNQGASPRGIRRCTAPTPSAKQSRGDPWPRGERLHQKSHKWRSIGTYHWKLLGISGEHPLDKWQSFGKYHWQVAIRWKVPLKIHGHQCPQRSKQGDPWPHFRERGTLKGGRHSTMFFDPQWKHCLSSARSSVQWQPDGLTIHTKSDS